MGGEGLRKVACPHCGSEGTGRYLNRTRRFVCVDPACDRCGQVLDYSEFAAEVERETAEFFERLPGLAPGTSQERIGKIAGHLLRRRVDPHLALQLVAAWNTLFGRPPMASSAVVRAVESVAAKLARRSAA